MCVQKTVENQCGRLVSVLENKNNLKKKERQNIIN